MFALTLLISCRHGAFGEGKGRPNGRAGASHAGLGYADADPIRHHDHRGPGTGACRLANAALKVVSLERHPAEGAW